MSSTYRAFNDAQLLDQLRDTIANLGSDGGAVSPAVYDTAQGLRFYPPTEGVEPALTWLLNQQQADGGWGNPAIPASRDVPTLAALLAVAQYVKSDQARYTVDAGLTFLRLQADQWANINLDSLPIAAEMILPALLVEARQSGLEIDLRPYKRLFQLREKKLQVIQQRVLAAGTPPTYSWESMGDGADPSLIDASGGVGHSPAATARWLFNGAASPAHYEARRLADRYMARASAATGVGIPGVLPNVWPITQFELTYGLYGLLLTGFLHHPELASVVQLHAQRLETLLRSQHGLSFGLRFSPDVDSTGVGIAVLAAMGRQVDPEPIYQFQKGDHFETFRGELNASVLSNAHALHGLRLAGHEPPSVTETFMIERQRLDGWWEPDKWHASPIYLTLEVVAMLEPHRYEQVRRRAMHAVLASQHHDGGWGVGSQANAMDTSYALTMLQLAGQSCTDTEALQAAQGAGLQWLFDHEQSNTKPSMELWLGKELYSPYRVDRIYQLGAMLMSLQNAQPFSPVDAFSGRSDSLACTDHADEQREPYAALV